MKLLTRSTYLLAFFCAIISTATFGQDLKKVGLLSISDPSPKAGKTIQVQYSFPPSNESKPVYYFGVGDQSYAYDLSLSENLSAEIFIPDSVDVVAFNVANQIGGYDNNNGEGYLFNVYSANTKKVNTPVAMNYFKLQNESLLDLDINRAELFQEIKSAYLSNRSGFDYSLSQLLSDAISFKDDAFVDVITEEIIAQQKVADLSNLEELLFYNGNKENAKIVLGIINTNYPKSQEALNKRVRALRDIKDRNEYEVAIKNLEQNFDTEESDRFNNTVSTYYKQTRQYEEYVKYQEKVKNPINKANNLNSLAWNISTNGGGEISFAGDLSQKAILLLEEEKQAKSFKYPLMTVSAYEVLIDNYLRKYYETFALAKYLQNDLKTATENQLVAVADFDEVRYNETYLFYLKQANNNQAIADVGEIMLSNGEMNSDMLELFQTSYKNVYPNRTNLDEKLKLLKLRPRNN